MPGYMNSTGNGYYEGDRQPGDRNAPERPSLDHRLVDGEWVLPPDLYRAQRIVRYEAEIPIGDQLDALAKGIDGPEWLAVVAKRAEIKLAIPKQEVPSGE